MSMFAAPKKKSGLIGMLSKVSIRQPSGAGEPPALDLLKYAVKPNGDGYNKFIPKNLYLIPGGHRSGVLPLLFGILQQSAGRNGDFPRQHTDPETILVEALKTALEQLPGSWKVFFDTDGDLAFSPCTRVATRIAAGVVMPLEPTKLDFR